MSSMNRSAGRFGEEEKENDGSNVPPISMSHARLSTSSSRRLEGPSTNIEASAASVVAPGKEEQTNDKDHVKNEVDSSSGRASSESIDAKQQVMGTMVQGLQRKRHTAPKEANPPQLEHAETVRPNGATVSSTGENTGAAAYNNSEQGEASPPRLEHAETVGPDGATVARSVAASRYSREADKASMVSGLASDVHDDLVNSKIAKSNDSTATVLVQEYSNRQGDLIREDQAQPGAFAIPGVNGDDDEEQQGWLSQRPDELVSEQATQQQQQQERQGSSPHLISATRVDEPVMVHATAVRGYWEMIRHRKYKVLGAVAVVATAVGVALGVTLSSSDSGSGNGGETSFGPTLQEVRKRGVLRCGVSNKVGFSLEDEDTGNRDGYEVDLCKAVAAAVLGESYQVETIVTTASERFGILANGTVDMVSHSATHTMERDVFEASANAGFTFSDPYLYDGLGFGGVPPYGSCANNVNTLGECQGLKVCVEAGTTHIDVLRRVLPSSNTVVRDTDQLVFRGLIDGDCNAIAGEQFNIANVTVRSEGYAGPYEAGRNLFSKEPLGIVTRDGDAEFADFVNWVLRALLIADAQNITQASANEIGTTSAFGDEFENMFIDAISVVGNYGDMYDRHLESIVPRQGLNLIYDTNHPETGLLYAHPFGTVLRSPAGPGPVTGGALERIVQRGFLRCGVSDRTGSSFVQLNNTNDGEEWSGLDVDYCRALSASIFGGSVEEIEFVSAPEENDGFTSLANGDVDVLAGGILHLERDAVDPTLGEVGFSFSQPYFYATADTEGVLRVGDTLSLVTNRNDTQWSDFVYWIVAATFYAEENGITRESSNDMPEVNLFGPQYGRMFRDAILAVGNYEQIYTRNVESFFPRAGPNRLNVIPQGPQHYLFPFTE